MKKIVNNTHRDIWYECADDVETWHVDYNGDWHEFESFSAALSFAEHQPICATLRPRGQL